MCMTSAVCMKYRIISGTCTYVLYRSDSSCVGVFPVFIVLYVQYVYVMYIRTLVCCVHFSETVTHTSACTCKVFSLL